MVEREEARAAKDFGRADEIRDELAGLGWEVGTPRTGRGWCPKAQMADARSSTDAGRSRRPNGGRRRCTASGGRRKRREELERLCGSPDHQGVVAEVDPYPYGEPGAMLRGESPLIVALDQVQDPRNLGAVCRSAEFAGAAGVVVPERRAAAVTAVTCKASAGAVEHLAIAHVRNLADWLAEAKQAGFWIWGADAEAEQAPWSVDLSGPDRPRPRRRGQGAATPRRRRLRRAAGAASTRPGRVAERLRRGHRAALRGGSPARAEPLQADATAFAKVAIWG